MEFRKLVFAVVLLSIGGVSFESLAQTDDGHQHHHHVSPDNAYTRSVVSCETPNVRMLDTNGTEISLHDSLDGPGPVLLNFIFTTCSTICPVMSGTFSQIQAKLGSNSSGVRLVSISIDPEQDTPSRLKEYANKFDAGPQWSMLTGSVENSIAVQRAFNVYRGDKMNHEPVTFMRKGPDQPWVRITGFISADDLVMEYRKLAAN